MRSGWRQMTRQDDATLKPFATAYARMRRRIERMTDDQLYDVIRAAERTSTTNVWWASYNVAPSVRQWAEAELQRRAYEREKASAVHDSKDHSDG